MVLLYFLQRTKEGIEMADIKQSMTELIGRTPILKLNRYSEEAGVSGADILAKLEYLNPAGSVKDRVALNMIEDAEKKGLIKKGYDPETGMAFYQLYFKEEE